MFLGRTRELDALKKLYHSGSFEFAVIYGRRRVGKTALISEFIKDKENIFFTAIESGNRQNLRNLSRAIMEDRALPDLSFDHFQSALEYVFHLSMNQRIIFVIDEYPYLAKGNASLASTLQMLIDKYKGASKLFLILCGSSISYMEDHLLSYKAPLYGRKTAQFKIDPFDFFEAKSFFKSLSDEEKALAYGIFGGTPQYLLYYNEKRSLAENIQTAFLNPMSGLFDEPMNLLKQEMREPGIYNAIIAAIASGASKMNEIATQTGTDSATCAMYLKNLILLGIIKKEFPYGSTNTRKTIYSIEDNAFRFWYRFVSENISLITRGAGTLAYQRIEPELSSYMGNVFEEICKQYLWRQLLSNQSKVAFSELGRWWGTNPYTKRQEEIDIMAADKSAALFAECKWTNTKVDQNVLERLIQRSSFFEHQTKYYYLFSKSGFTKDCIDLAKTQKNVTLLTYPEMLK